MSDQALGGFIALALLFLWSLIMMSLLANDTVREMRLKEELQREAVKRGFATWVVDDDGKTTFTWKDAGQIVDDQL